MQLIKQQLQRKNDELQHLITTVENSQQIHRPEKLMISKNDGVPRYYTYEKNPETGKRKKHYLNKEKTELVRLLAQQKYDHKLLMAAKQKLSNNQRALRCLDDTDLSELYTDLGKDWQTLINPRVVSNEEYAKLWDAVAYEPGYFKKDAPVYITNRGERVRSKSEMLIANYLFMKGIPYRYEYPVKMQDGKETIIVRIDFMLLNKWTHEVFFFEHFGRMGDPGYLEDMMRKLELYSKNGIYVGKNFLLSVESDTHPLNMQYIETILQPILTH